MPLFVLPSQKFLDQSKLTSESWHSGSNGHTSIAGYLPKNRSPIMSRPEEHFKGICGLD